MRRRPYGREKRGSAGRFGALLVLTLAFAAKSAVADPQYNAGLVAGVCGRGSGFWDSTCFYGGARGDAIFGRRGPHDFGVGPYASVASAAFDDVRLGGGATLHIPVHDTFPLLLSAGSFARASADGWKPGAAADLFFGSRSYNYHSKYVLCGGLTFGFERTFGSSPENVLYLAARVDAFLLALPFVIAYEALRGPSD